jgi:hypothetical protein
MTAHKKDSRPEVEVRPPGGFSDLKTVAASGLYEESIDETTLFAYNTEGYRRR